MRVKLGLLFIAVSMALAILNYNGPINLLAPKTNTESYAKWTPEGWEKEKEWLEFKKNNPDYDAFAVESFRGGKRHKEYYYRLK